MLKKNTYRPDIDGLRALAVLAVVLFHLSPTLLPNGFLGVDIFFVISGFLITTILYREMEQNNFSFPISTIDASGEFFPFVLW